MKYTLDLQNIQPESVMALDAELGRARAKFPQSRRMLDATLEELGEVARAYLQGNYAHARREAVQVACTAMRIYEEGDASFEGVERDPAEMKA